MLSLHIGLEVHHRACPTRSQRFVLIRIAMQAGCALVAVCVLPILLRAQQYITDDAAITEFRACQMQIWHGERSSWALPVCTPIRNLEISAGLIAVWRDEADGHPEYVVQVKTLLLPRANRRWSVAFVLGTGRDPGLSGIRNSGFNVYAYVPVSAAFFADRVIVHQNIGYLYDHRAGHYNDKDWLTTASRADISLRKYFVIVGEIYDSAGSDAEYQAGVRWWGRPGVVQFDLSYGGLLKKAAVAAGWTLGVALTTPRIL